MQTSAYRRALCEKFVVNQQRMIEGTDPRTNKPGGGSGISRGESSSWPPMMKLVSSPRLLVRPDAECILCTEWPAELCLPSDLWDSERSVIG